MSLIRVRRRRNKNWIDARKGMPAQRLMGLLVLIMAFIWYLSTQF